jgi:hypothetical protein
MQCSHLDTNYIVKCVRNSRRGFGLDIGFIDHIITFNYSAIAYFHTLQITRVQAKYFPARNVFSSSCMVTASNNIYSSASGLKSSLNGGSHPTELN